MNGMSTAVPPAPSARVAATTPLRRSGLLCVLRDAGVRAAGDDDETSVTVRTTDDLSSGSPIELRIGAEDVQLQLRSIPSGQEWQVLIQLVESVIGRIGLGNGPSGPDLHGEFAE